MATDPLPCLPVDRLLLQPYENSVSKLPDVEPSVKHLLLFAQLLAKVATTGGDNGARPVQETSTADIAVFLRHLSDASNCAAASHVSSATHLVFYPTEYLTLLHGALLVLKLASLAHNVKADFLGHADTDIPVAVQALWETLVAIDVRIRTHVKEVAVPVAADLKSELAAHEERRLASTLCHHLILVLRRTTKESASSHRPVACCALLDCLVSVADPEQRKALVAEMLRLGKRQKF